jgi:hypothetical protein
MGSPPSRPSRIGKYEVERPLGRGGSGSVYLANDPILGRRVALKVLPHHLAADAESQHRFMREARLVARLSHPNILSIFDVGEADGSFYIAMEYVDGASASSLLKANPSGIEVTEAVRIAVEVGRALEYAHSQGVVHRDVKPGNVLVESSGQVRLTDFGIATGDTAAPEETATVGTVQGTPGYIAPEIILGSASDHRVDIFSLGALLYALLTGHRPFEAPTAMGEIMRTLQEPPRRASELRPQVSADLDAILSKALAAKASERFATVVAMIAELSRFTGTLAVDESWPAWKAAVTSALLSHGIVRPIELEHIVPASHIAYAFERFARENTALKLTTDEHGGLRLARARLVEDLSAAWAGVESKRTEAPSLTDLVTASGVQLPTGDLPDLLLHIVHQLAQALGTSFAPLGGDQPGMDVFPTAFTIDTRAAFAGTKLPGRVPILFSMKDVLEERDLRTIRALLARLPYGGRRFALLTVVGPDAAVAAAREACDNMRRLHGDDVVVLGRRDLMSILAAHEPSRAMRKLIFSQVNLTTVSPFVTSGPVPNHVFFGREAVLHTIGLEAGTKSFAIVGGRRIGKSSLLARLHNDRLPEAGLRTLYHDCSVTPSFESFMDAPASHWRRAPPPGAQMTFRDVLDRPPDGPPLVILLDEADKLVLEDQRQGWRLFLTLRAAAHAGRAQFVFSGERGLAEALRASGGPLFNFAGRINLGRLDYRAVEELVRVPMSQMEIDLAGATAVVDLIWKYTSGHPNVVQRLCQRLVERTSGALGNRTLAGDDVLAAVNEPAFLEEDFLETYWERATPLERIISLLMAPQARAYQLMEIIAMLSVHDLRPRPAVVKAALDRLVELRCLLEHTAQGYQFAVEAFPWAVGRSATSEDLLFVLKTQYAEDVTDGAS